MKVAIVPCISPNMSSLNWATRMYGNSLLVRKGRQIQFWHVHETRQRSWRKELFQVRFYLYWEWLDKSREEWFLENIPPTRPVLIIEDGHSSHISMEVIKLAQEDMHLLFLPSNTTHLLQPLDVAVFNPFKSYLNKACQKSLSSNPGRVVVLAQGYISCKYREWIHEGCYLSTGSRSNYR